MFNNIWNTRNYDTLRKYLLNNCDSKYKDFNGKIVSTTKYEMLGVRVPLLRTLAKEIYKTDYISYFDNFNYKYYEEIFIYGIVLSYIKDKDIYAKYLNVYIDKIDNWALCDSFLASSKVIEKNKDYFYKVINKYINSKKEYYIRVGLVILLNYYIDKEYLKNIFEIANKLNTDKYYANMALAWLLSFCYIKYPEETYKYLLDCKLSSFVFNKTISKICDSYRVNDKEKARLRKIRY